VGDSCGSDIGSSGNESNLPRQIGNAWTVSHGALLSLSAEIYISNGHQVVIYGTLNLEL